jgi:AcrR family transcriptional regulator
MRIKVNTKRPRGRPSGDHEERQREITDVLLQVIGVHGFDKASMRLVARQANCTTGVLTHYFSSKEELLCRAGELLFDWAEQLARDAAAGGDSLRALQIVSGVVEHGEQPSFDFWSVWLQVLSKARQNQRLADVVRKRYGKFRKLLTEIIRAGQARGQIRSDVEASLLADHVNAVTDGLGLMAPIESGRLTQKRIRDVMQVSIEFLRPVSK